MTIGHNGFNEFDDPRVSPVRDSRQSVSGMGLANRLRIDGGQALLGRLQLV